MKTRARILFAAIAVSAFASASRAELLSAPFDGISNFSLVVVGDANLGSGVHVHGGGYIGGNLTVGGSNGGFGQDLPAGSLGLFVGGNINSSSAGSKQIALFNKDYYVGGSISGAHFQNPGAALGANPLAPNTPVSISASLGAKAGLLGAATSFGATIDVSDFNAIKFNLTAGAFNVINLDSSFETYFSQSNRNVQFSNFTEGTKVLINYTGDGELSFAAKNQNVGSSLFDDVIWNFMGDSKITFENSVSTFKGTIFAPDSEIVWNANDIDGQLVAGSLKWANTSQSHFFTPWTPFQPIPEPSAYGLVGAALLLGISVARRRAARSRAN